MRLRALGLIAVMAAWCFTAGAQGQTAASTEKEPMLRVRADAVVVDVVVTRENGDAVTSLRKENFKVTEDGKEQFIDFFEEHFSKTLPPGALPPMPKLPPNVYTNVPQVPESDSVNILLLDSLNTPFQDQSYVHKQIMDYLKTMAPGTRTAIFLLGSKLRFVQGFTTDASLLSAALNDKKNSPVKEILLRTREDNAEDARQLEFMREAANGHTTGGMMAVMEADHEVGDYQFTYRISMTLEALNYLARYLGGVPGRKNLIWFASSFPVTVFPNYGQMVTLNDNLHVQASEIKKTADLLTVSKVAVYPVGAQGIMNDHWMEGDNADTGRIRGAATLKSIAGFGGENDVRAMQIMAMEQLADDTGGKAYFNTNDLNMAVKRAINDGAHYYTLAYTPTNNKRDGSYRRIEVKVSATGKYKTAYRHGYNADDVKTAEAGPESDPLRPLLKFGLPDVSQLLYGVRVAPAAQQPAPNAKQAGMNPALTGPVTRYAIDFLIRWTDVAFDLRRDGTHHGKIQVGLQAYDRDGKAVNWEDGTQEMNIKPETWAAIQKSGIPAHMEIDLPNEDIYLNTGVYDWRSNKAGTLEIPLSPSKATSAQSAPSTPGVQ